VAFWCHGEDDTEVAEDGLNAVDVGLVALLAVVPVGVAMVAAPVVTVVEFSRPAM
jgi:hypothetical protein